MSFDAFFPAAHLEAGITFIAGEHRAVNLTIMFLPVLGAGELQLTDRARVILCGLLLSLRFLGSGHVVCGAPDVELCCFSNFFKWLRMLDSVLFLLLFLSSSATFC